MTQALDTLTDKEKETLRLIVRGHDAKSAARDLHLSVHTINERLRTARRKLDVTSSREAARLLLESEGGASENLGYKGLGDVCASDPSDDPPIRKTARKRAIWIGGITMTITFGIAALLASMGLISHDRPVGDPATTIETAQLETFEASARQWLALVDESDWEGSFSEAGRTFRDLNTVALWRDASQQARAPLGAVTRRRATSAEYVNAPPRGYVVMRFNTQFENRSDAVEVVTLELEGDVWKVVGYVIE